MNDGCYKCGSSAGDSVRLCPACNKLRRQERLEQNAGPAHMSVPGRGSTAVEFNPMDYVKYSLMGVFAIGFLYFLGFSTSGPGIFMSSSTRVYRACMQNFAAQNSNRVISASGAESHALGREFEEAMNELSTGFGEVMCQMLKQQCENNPRSRECRMAKSAVKSWK